MKIVFLEDIPKVKNSRYFDWKKAAKDKIFIRFIYDDIQGKVQILDRKYTDRTMILVKYKEIERYMSTDQFTRGEIGRIVNFIPVAISDPKMVQYFINVEQAYEYSRNSNKRVFLKCPDCGKEKDKDIRIADLCMYGFSCDACSDGISYPEKFIFYTLKELGIEFERQKIFEWSKNIVSENKRISKTKRYDFYFFYNNKSYIIEAHGEQHYKDTGFKLKSKGRRSLKDEQENDEIKKNLANENRIDNYIVLDCRESTLDFIKNSILNSKLNSDFNLSKVDWDICNEKATKNFVKLACQLWTDGYNKQQIMDLMDIGRSTLNKYLNKGHLLGWCTHIGIEEKRKQSIINGNKLRELKGNKVIYVEKNKSFRSINSLVQYFNRELGVKINGSKVSGICKGNKKPYDGYTFRFLDQEGNIIEPQITYKAKKRRGNKVMCIENKMIFDSCNQAAGELSKVLKINFNGNGISDVCRGKRKDRAYKGYHFKYL